MNHPARRHLLRQLVEAAKPEDITGDCLVADLCTACHAFREDGLDYTARGSEPVFGNHEPGAESLGAFFGVSSMFFYPLGLFEPLGAVNETELSARRAFLRRLDVMQAEQGDLAAARP